MAKDAASLSTDSVAPTGTTRKSEAGDNLRAMCVVVALAAGFAAIPRISHGCEGPGEMEIATDFSARLVANADHVGARLKADGSPADDAVPTKLELSSLRGRLVILDFWATWCGPCQAEAPIMDGLAQRYKDRGLAVVGVNTSDEDGLAAAFVRRKGLSFPIVFDENNVIARQYGVQNLPTLIVVSKEGKVVAVRHGVTSDSALDDIVRRYL